MNTSDHLPITVTLKDISISCGESTPCKKRIAWSKLKDAEIYEKYTQPLEDMITETMFPLTTGDNILISPSEIDSCIESIINAMLKCSDSLSYKKIKKCEKPFWNIGLTELSKLTKQKWHAWKDIGRPRGNNERYLQYKHAKKLFRSERHRAEIEYEQKKIQEVCQSQEMDQTYFWYLVNNSRMQKRHKTYPLKVGKDKVLIDPDEIRQCWKDYFAKLYTPQPKSHFDDHFKQQLDHSMENLLQESYQRTPVNKFQPFTTSDIQQLVRAIKCRTAPGIDGVQPEHIKHAGKLCIGTLTSLFNSISITEHVPSQFKYGVIIPIPKGDKDRALQNNYRGITLLPCIAKLYEKAILTRISKWVKQNNLIDDLQGANQAKCSSLHTNWLVREAISYYQEKDSTVYVGLLDVAKAFDSVWHNGLFYMLYEKGMDGKLWRILINTFKSFKCCVSIDGKLSEYFEALQGLHQGAPFSMLGFSLYNDKLIRYLKQNQVGLAVGDIIVTSPAFADDLTVMAPNIKALQILLNKIYDFSSKWRLEFNPEKCRIVVYGKDKAPHVKLMIGDRPIERCDAHSHVGTVLTQSKSEVNKYMKLRIKACKRVTSAISAIGSRKAPVTPVSASHLYKTLCLPKLLYGLEVMDITDTAMNEVESFQAQVAKSIQRLPDHTCNIGATRTMGWISIRGQVDILRLVFLWRLIILPLSCIYKKLLIYRYVGHELCDFNSSKGPLWKALETASAYGLLEKVKLAIETGEYDDIKQWIKIVKEKTRIVEQKRWDIQSSLYSSLTRVRKGMLCNELTIWWKYVQYNPSEMPKCIAIIQMLLEVHQLNSCRFRYNKSDIKSSLCDKCQMYEVETVDHLLFRCTSLCGIRNTLWNNVLQNCPSETLRSELQCMPDSHIATFLLSGLHNTYIYEWYPLYEAIASFYL
jgi:hypothetical protein